MVSVLFVRVYWEFLLLTHILTHTGKLPDSTGEEAADGVSRFGLHCGGDVGVGVQSKTRGVVAQHSGQGFDVYAILESQDREFNLEISLK